MGEAEEKDGMSSTSSMSNDLFSAASRKNGLLNQFFLHTQ